MVCNCVSYSEGWGGLSETSASPFLLTKTVIHCNYTDGLKYTERWGITLIMQSWLKLGPHARVLHEHGRSQDVQQRTEHIRCDHLNAEDQFVNNFCDSLSMFLFLWLNWKVIEFDGLVHRDDFLVLTEGKLLMFNSQRILMKMDQSFNLLTTAHSVQPTALCSVLCCVAA